MDLLFELNMSNHSSLSRYTGFSDTTDGESPSLWIRFINVALDSHTKGYVFSAYLNTLAKFDFVSSINIIGCTFLPMEGISEKILIEKGY